MFTVSENSSSAWEEKLTIQQVVRKVPGVAAQDRAVFCLWEQCLIVMRTDWELQWQLLQHTTLSEMVRMQCLTEPGTLPQHSQPLPETPSQHCSCHTVKEQLVKGRSDLPYCEVHVSPLCDSVCLYMERKYWSFCFDLSSSDLIYKCCLVFNARLSPVKKSLWFFSSPGATHKAMDCPIWHRCVFFYRRRQNLYREISSLEIQVIA